MEAVHQPANAGEPSGADADRRQFHVLDALRGVAAILVVPRHADLLFAHGFAPESFLAVDLFFVMSGVVIASAYERALLAGGSPVAFLKVRVLRLWPLYLIGLVLGLIQFIGNSTQHGHEAISTGLVGLQGFALALLMLPASPTLDGPRWSLMFEMIANIVYGFAARLLTNSVLFAVLAASGVGIVYSATGLGTLDVGYMGGQFGAGIARVGFSFTAGLLIFRFYRPERELPSALAWLCIAVAAAILALPVPRGLTVPYELVAAILAFPGLVAVAMRTAVSARAAKAFGFLGVTSYAVYIIHQPAAHLFEAALKRLTHRPADAFAPAGGIAFIIALISACWLLDRIYDRPVRAIIGKRLKIRLRPPLASGQPPTGHRKMR